MRISMRIPTHMAKTIDPNKVPTNLTLTPRVKAEASKLAFSKSGQSLSWLVEKLLRRELAADRRAKARLKTAQP
jgi:hypothetical protein